MVLFFVVIDDLFLSFLVANSWVNLEYFVKDIDEEGEERIRIREKV